MQGATSRTANSTGFRKPWRAPLAAGLTAFLAAAQSQAAPKPQPSTTTTAAEAAIIERGEATWYGPRHAGLRTSSGARFDPHRLTAAHSSLPLGSWVRVTDDATGKSVVVMVNDREPPHGVRCIDLSQAAAERLGMRGRGVADVTLSEASAAEAVELAEAPEPRAPARHVSARHGRQHRRHAAQ
jgi:rare lipoprotein A (peptidoglycan hydrolase)